MSVHNKLTHGELVLQVQTLFENAQCDKNSAARFKRRVLDSLLSDSEETEFSGEKRRSLDEAILV